MHWLPEGVSTYSPRIDQMFYVILVVTGTAFVLTEGILFYFAWRYRHRDGVRAKYTHGNSRLEVIWTIVPAVMLVFLGLASKTVWGEIKGSIPPTDQEVVVMASQFDWEVRYKGVDGQFDCALGCLELKRVLMCVRAVQTRVKANGNAPRLLIPARRVNVHVAQISASALHNRVVMRVHCFQGFWGRLNRERLISEPVGFDQASN